MFCQTPCRHREAGAVGLGSMLMMKGRTVVIGTGLLGWIAGLLACAAAFASDVALAQGTLDSVKKRAQLHCGISPVAPGFSELDDTGSRRGFDVDICRAVAAAVFGDARRVEFT